MTKNQKKKNWILKETHKIRRPMKYKERAKQTNRRKKKNVKFAQIERECVCVSGKRKESQRGLKSK